MLGTAVISVFWGWVNGKWHQNLEALYQILFYYPQEEELFGLTLLWVCCVCSSEEEDRGRSGRMEGYIEDEGVGLTCDESICSPWSLASAAADPAGGGRGAGRSAAGRKEKQREEEEWFSTKYKDLIKTKWSFFSSAELKPWKSPKWNVKIQHMSGLKNQLIFQHLLWSLG